jgi:hypothetical protein
MSNLTIRIDGTSKEVPEGTPVRELLQDHAPEVRKKAIAASINGRQVDLFYPVLSKPWKSFVIALLI